jgi:hypothetical protein
LTSSSNFASFIRFSSSKSFLRASSLIIQAFQHFQHELVGLAYLPRFDTTYEMINTILFVFRVLYGVRKRTVSILYYLGILQLLILIFLQTKTPSTRRASGRFVSLQRSSSILFPPTLSQSSYASQFSYI